MTRRLIADVLATLGVVTALAAARAQAPAADGRDADRAAIRAHIESICQAFLDGDVRKIHATHTEDWRGFLENSRTPIKGIDDYMRANGIPWPLPADAAPRPGTLSPARAFQVADFDVHFYTPDIAVANFNVDFGQKTGRVFTTGTRYRIMDIYVRRKGEWNQAASHTVIDPAWRAEQMTRPQLDKLVPEDTIVLEGPLEKPFTKKAEILESARRAAERGNKLTRLQFPQTEIQVYGNTAVIYTTYLYELQDPQGQRQTSTGKATEIFVRRNGAWVNPGWHLTPIK